MLTNSPVGITLPIFKCPPTTWNSVRNKEMIVVTHDECSLPLTISQILKSANYKNDLRLCTLINKNGVPEVNMTRYMTDALDNRIICGGLYTNPDAFEIMKQILPKMKFSCTNKSYDAAKLENNEFFKMFANPEAECDNTAERHIRYGEKANEIVPFNRNHNNVGVIIRLTGKEAFENFEKGTIHIWFGLSTITTVQIVNSFLSCSNSLYELTKNHKGNYAFILNITLTGDINFSQAVDITKYLQI